ncbi:hypothetical protein Dimus_036314 [Dionaea muscipula]
MWFQDLGRKTLEASWIDVYGSPMARRLVDLPRVMMRHMSYVISMKDHELPYGDWLTMGEWSLVDGKWRERGEEMMIWILRKKRREKEDEGNKDGFDWEAMIDESCG